MISGAELCGFTCKTKTVYMLQKKKWYELEIGQINKTLSVNSLRIYDLIQFAPTLSM